MTADAEPRPIRGVWISGLRVTTNDEGYYSRLLVEGSRGTLRAKKAGYSFRFNETNNEESFDYWLIGDERHDITGEMDPMTISGYVRTAADGTAVPDVEMRGLPEVETDGVAGPVKTDHFGWYARRVPLDWTGTVTPQMAGFTFSPPNWTYYLTQSSHTKNYTLDVERRLIHKVWPPSGPPATRALISLYIDPGPHVKARFTPNGGEPVDCEVLGWVRGDISFRVPRNAPLGRALVTIVLPFGMESYGWTFTVRDPYEIYVGSNEQAPYQANGSVDYPFDTIQEGIDFATDGDFVYVKDGTYGGEGNYDISFRGKAITVTSTSGAANCIIYCGLAGRGFIFNSGEGDRSVLRNVTIYAARPGGSFSKGGGIYCYRSSPTIEGNRIVACEAYDGAGIYCYRSSPTIEGNTLTGNRARFNGGGIFCDGGSAPTIEGNTLTGNAARYGGGIFCDGGSAPTIEGNTLTGNTATFRGGGIYCVDSSPSLEIRGNPIHANTAYVYGAGIYCENSSPTIEGNEIVDNIVDDGGGDTDGGGGGIACLRSSSPEIRGNWIKTNKTSPRSGTCSGGGIFTENSSPTIVRNFFYRNDAIGGHGGAISASGGAPTVDGNIMAGNQTTGAGGGIYAAGVATLTLRGNTIFGNAANNFGGGVFFDACTVTVTNCILWGNSAGISLDEIVFTNGSDVTVAYSDVQGGRSEVLVWGESTLNWDDQTNLNEDPLFANPGADDYHLKSTVGRYDPSTGLPPINPLAWKVDADEHSPCIDAGELNLEDWADEPAPNGARINMGAYGGTAQASKSAAAGASAAKEAKHAAPGGSAPKEPESAAPGPSAAKEPESATPGESAPKEPESATPDDSTAREPESAAPGASTVKAAALDGIPAITGVEPLDGPPGTQGLVTGTELGDTPGSVRYTPTGGGAMDWEVLSWSDTEVAFRVPEGTPLGTGELKIVRSDAAESNAAAFEVTDPAILYVDKGNTSRVENGSRAHPFNTIQEGINAATDGDAVLVADGTYTGAGNRDIRFRSRAITVSSENGPAVCVIDCQQLGRAFSFVSRETDQSVLTGFTIANGRAGEDSGGGIYCYYSSPTIRGNIIRGCSAYAGGAIYCGFSSPTIAGNTLTGNTATYWGGGIACSMVSWPAITGNLISGNAAGEFGGGIFVYSSSPAIRGNTISGNRADNAGGGILCSTASSATIGECILWANSAPLGSEIALGSADNPSDLTVAYCDVQGGRAAVHVEPACYLNWGEGNLDADPRFANPDGGDYHLTSKFGRYDPALGLPPSNPAAWTADPGHSPCIDAGDPLAAFSAEPGPNGGRVNMGAYGNSDEASMSRPTISGFVRKADGTGVPYVSMDGLPGDPSTGNDGSYSSVVDPGWSGTVTPRSWRYTFDPASRAYSNVASSQPEQNYTATAGEFTISGHVRTEGGTGIPDVVMDGLPGSPTTDPDGFYSATVDYGFTGMVRPQHESYWFTVRYYDFPVLSDQTDQDYTGTARAFTISGTVRTGGGTGIPDVVMNGLPGDPTTDAVGGYSATVGLGWSGAVAPEKTGYTFTPPSRSYGNLASDQFSQDYTAPSAAAITSAEPSDGPAWSRGIITGTELGDRPGSVQYTPDGGTATDWIVLRWSPTEVAFRVPHGTPLGTGELRIVRSDAAETTRAPFEVTDPAIVYVDDVYTWGVENGSRAHPFDTFQEGINAATDGDTVMVLDGTYSGVGNREIDFDHKAITVRSENGPAACIIDCRGLGRAFYFHMGETEQSVLTGFTIEDGTMGDGPGGAIYCEGSSPTITGNVIRGCSARSGGGIFCAFSSATIAGNVIYGNTASSWGGGVACWYADPTIRANVITGNSAGEAGGAIFCYSSAPPIQGNTIAGNRGNDGGGGIACVGFSSPSISDCILWANVAASGNELALESTASPSAPTVVYGDVQGGQGAAHVAPGCTLDWGDGNLDADPGFADPGHWDDSGTPGDPTDDSWVQGEYHLRSTVGRYDPATGLPPSDPGAWVVDAVLSLAIDAGDPTSAVGTEPTPNGSRINMGAYGGTAEASKTPMAGNRPPQALDDPATVVQGSGSNPIDVLANDGDPDGDPLTITEVTTPLHGAATAGGGYVDYTPAPGYAGDDTFEYTVSDGNGGTDTATVTVTVALPPPPIADAGPDQTVEVGDTVTLDGSGSHHPDDAANVALAANGATITGTNGAAWSALIDGNSTAYTGTTGFGYTHWATPPGSMTVTLAQTHRIGRIRVKLWDGDTRYYRYYVEAAASPGGPWQTVVNRTSGVHQGWCEDSFAPVDARYLRIVGTYGSANSGFHAVEFEAYAARPLTYAWTQVAGLPVTLSDATAVNPTFTPADADDCEFDLVVHDGVQPSAPDRVEVTASLPPPPMAVPGPDLVVEVGERAQLSGAASRPGKERNVALAANGATAAGTNGANWAALIDGDSTNYTGGTGFGYTYWRSRPRGSMTVTLAQASVIHRIRVKLWDLDARYYRYYVEAATDPAGPWQTVVNRASGSHQGWSEDDFGTPVEARYLRITGTYNSANAGFHVVEFEAYAAEPLEYQWTLVSAPAASQATLDAPTSVEPGFVPDEVGLYVFELVVNDGAQSSAPEQVTVMAVMPPRPLADAGPYQTAQPGDTVTLDASGSRSLRKSDNVALAANGAMVTGTNGAGWAQLIDGNSTEYTGGTGFAYTYWPGPSPGTMTVTLSHVYALTRVRAKLWHGDSRFYRYHVQVATSLGGPWSSVVDRTAGEHRDWSEDTFGPVQARYIRITGTHNSANNGFHVVELEAYADRPLTYAWTQVSGPSATLSDGSAVTPTFTPTAADDYQFQLVVNDGLQDSLPDRAWVSVGMPPLPVADAGPNQNALAGDTVTLDGSGSRAADQTNVALAANGATVTGLYGSSWPALIDGDSTNYTGGTGFAYTTWRPRRGHMTVTLAQVYQLSRVRVKLWDGDSRYYRYYVEVATDLGGPWQTVVNRTSGAHQGWGEDTFGPVQARYIRITGTYSSANNGFHVVELEAYADGPLTYAWSQVSAPQGSQATLGDPSAAGPTFVPDVAGDYEFELVVNDGAQDSLPDRVGVSVRMPPLPVADAGPDQAASVGDTVTLDGSASRAGTASTNVALAANGATVTGTNGTRWAELIDGNSTQYTGGTGYGYTYWPGPSPGTMTVTLAQAHALTRLRVKLWDGDSRFYRYRVQVATSPGGPWTTVVDRTVGQHRSWIEDTFGPVQAEYIRITGTHNSANNGFHVVELEAYADRPLAYAWTQVSGPPVTLSDPSAVRPTFTPTVADDCDFELVVNDGIQDSLPDRVRVEATEPAAAQAEQGISLVVTPDSGPAPLEVQALVLGAKPGAARKWDFGDGTSGSGDEVTHTYWSPGMYTLTVKVDRKVARATVVVEDPHGD